MMKIVNGKGLNYKLPIDSYQGQMEKFNNIRRLLNQVQIRLQN